MNCCKKPMRITDTRKYNSGKFEYVERVRVCRVCKQQMLTIEVDIDVWERRVPQQKTP